MTVQQITEEILQQFPQLGERQVLLHIDRAQKEFCRETRTLIGTAKCAGIASTVVFTLPATFISMIEVIPYNADGIVTGMEWVDYKIDSGKIHFFNMNETILTGIPSNVSHLYLVYYKLPTTIASITDTFSVKEELIYAIFYRVMETLSATIPIKQQAGEQVISARDWSAVRYFNSRYQEYVRMAKVDRNISADERYKLISYDIAGNFRLPGRQATDAEIEIVTSPTVTYAEKILDITAVESGTLFEGGSVPAGSVGITYQSGYGTISVGIVAGKIEVTSADGEFTQDTFVVPNQTVNYVWVSATLIRIDLPAVEPWGVLSVRISRRYVIET